MAVQDTPWFIGAANVLHPAEAARAVAFAASNGAGGVIGSSDLKVVALPTPTNKIRVMPGSITLINRYPGAVGQAYQGVVSSATDITIDPTTSAGPRSDLIYARVSDPQYGTQAGFNPLDPNNFNFFEVKVSKGVPAGSRSLGGIAWPGEPLARIDIPASTSTITSSMITDLRQKTITRNWRRIIPTFPTAVSSLGTNTAEWLTSGQPSVRVPEWANYCNVICHVAGAEKVVTGYVRASVKISVGGISTPDVTVTQNSPVQRFAFSFGGSVTIPASLRGNLASLSLRGVIGAGPNGAYQIDQESAVTFDIEFLESLE